MTLPDVRIAVEDWIQMRREWIPDVGYIYTLETGEKKYQLMEAQTDNYWESGNVWIDMDGGSLVTLSCERIHGTPA